MIGVNSESLAQMISSGDSITPVVEASGSAVAFAMAEISRAFVFAVFVRPGCEAMGYGRAALEAAESGLRANGVTCAWLTTGKDLGFRAHGFYRHLGWKHTGYVPDGQAKYEKTLQ